LTRSTVAGSPRSAALLHPQRLAAGVHVKLRPACGSGADSQGHPQAPVLPQPLQWMQLRSCHPSRSFPLPLLQSLLDSARTHHHALATLAAALHVANAAPAAHVQLPSRRAHQLELASQSCGTALALQAAGA
jgi:hypothetical protein